MVKQKITAGLIFTCLIFSCGTPRKAIDRRDSFINNPITEGYFADPCIVKDGDTYYIYATIDPWGGEELAVLETKNFKKFTSRHLNWPTKKACTSPASGGAMVWAPSVRKASMESITCMLPLAVKYGLV
jgi:beta-xylosidase